ncbi:hypothetical protein ACFX1Z_041465 [Malus domestica]
MKDPSRIGLNGIAIVELPLLIYNLTGLVTLTLRLCKYFKVGVGASLNDPEGSSYVEGKEEEAVAVGAILSDLDESSHKEEEKEEEKVVAPSRRGGREDMVLHLWRTWHQNYMKIELSENSRDLGGGKNKDLAEWSLRFCRVLSWWLISVFCAVVKH